MEIKLNLGSGKRDMFEYINIDAIKQTDNTIIGDILNLKYENDSIDKIFSEHVIEHLNKHEIENFFSECNRMLKQNGELELIAPALVSLINAYNNGTFNIQQLESALYADHVHEYDYHKQGIYEKKLVLFCEKYGFKIIEIKLQDRAHSPREIYLKAIKK